MVAITAHRFLHKDDGHISFEYKVYTDGNMQKLMRLNHGKFLRRLEQIILPKYFVKLQHTGYLHAKHKMERITAVYKQLALPAPMQKINTLLL